MGRRWPRLRTGLRPRALIRAASKDILVCNQITFRHFKLLLISHKMSKQQTMIVFKIMRKKKNNSFLVNNTCKCLMDIFLSITNALNTTKFFCNIILPILFSYLKTIRKSIIFLLILWKAFRIQLNLRIKAICLKMWMFACLEYEQSRYFADKGLFAYFWVAYLKWIPRTINFNKTWCEY